MRNAIALLFVVALLVFAGCAQQEMMPESPEQAPEDTESTGEQNQTSEESEMTGQQEPDVVVSLVGRNFEYEDTQGNINPDVVVSQGDLVRVEYTTESGFHDFVIDEFAATEQVDSAAGVQVIEFVANQAGTFEYYCSVGSHRAQGMSGSFVVE